MSDKLQIAALARMAGFDLAPGVHAKPLFGAQMMFNFLDFEPGAIVPLHSHPHEQLGLVLEGELLLISDGVERVLGPEDVYAIPGGMPHEGRAGDAGCRALDVFHPVREDYRTRFEGEGG